MPPFFAKDGITFTLVHLVGVFHKILFAVSTKESLPGTIGWIRDDEGSWWAENLKECFFCAVTAYVSTEAFMSGSHSDMAISKDLIAAHNPRLHGGGFRWLPMLPGYRSFDYTNYLRGLPHAVPLPHADGETVETEAPATSFAALDDDFPVQSQSNDTDFIPAQEILDDLVKDSINHKQEFVNAFMEDHSKTTANDIFARPPLPAQLEASPSKPPPHLKFLHTMRQTFPISMCG